MQKERLMIVYNIYLQGEMGDYGKDGLAWQVERADTRYPEDGVYSTNYQLISFAGAG